VLEADGIEFTGGNAPRGVEAGATVKVPQHHAGIAIVAMLVAARGDQGVRHLVAAPLLARDVSGAPALRPRKANCDSLYARRRRQAARASRDLGNERTRWKHGRSRATAGSATR